MRQVRSGLDSGSVSDRMYPVPPRNRLELLLSRPLSHRCPARYPFPTGTLSSHLLSLLCPVRHPIGYPMPSLLLILCPVRHPIGYPMPPLVLLPCPVRHPIGNRWSLPLLRRRPVRYPFSTGHLLSHPSSPPCPGRYPFPHRYPIRFRLICVVHRLQPVRYPTRFRFIPPSHPDPTPPYPTRVTGSHRLRYPSIPPRISNHEICTRTHPRRWPRCGVLIRPTTRRFV